MEGVVNNEAAHRFELHSDGYMARLDYRLDGDRIVLDHTVVPEELRGRGVGGALVSTALDHAAEHSLRVVPRCPFARHWLKRNRPDEIYDES